MMLPFYLPFLLTENKTQSQPNQQFWQEKEKKKKASIFIFSNKVGKEGRKVNVTNTIQNTSSVSSSSWKKMSQQPPPFKVFLVTKFLYVSFPTKVTL